MGDNLPPFAQETLLNAFRTHYHRFVERVGEVVGSRSDPIVIARLGDDLDEFAAIVAAVRPLSELKDFSYIL